MAPSAAEGVLDVYSEFVAGMAPSVAGHAPKLDSAGIGTRVAKLYGGFWDVFLMGHSFSYSIYCISYVSPTRPASLELVASAVPT